MDGEIVGNIDPSDPSICPTNVLLVKPIAAVLLFVLYPVAVPLYFITYVPAVVYVCEYVVLVVSPRVIVCIADPSPQSTVKEPLADIVKLNVVFAVSSIVSTQNCASQEGFVYSHATLLFH